MLTLERAKELNDSMVKEEHLIIHVAAICIDGMKPYAAEIGLLGTESSGAE